MPDLTGFVGTTSPVAGRMIAEFGQDLQRFGNTLSELSGDVGKAMYNGVVSQEVTAAKRLAYTRLNEFNYKILNGENTDYRSYLQAWDAYATDTLNLAVRPMTVQEAKDEFTDFWTGARQSNSVWLTERAASALVGEAEATALSAIEEAARQGNEPAVRDIIVSNARRGVLQGGKAQELGTKYIPIAHYNYIYNQLDALNDPDAAVQYLSDPGAVKATGLTSDEIEKMTRGFLFESQTRRAQADKIHLAEAEKAFGDISKKWDDGSLTDYNELLSAAAKTVGTEYETGVRGLVTKWQGLYGAGVEARVTREQDVEAAKMLAQLYTWRRAGGQGDAPWNLDTLTAKLEKSKLRTEQLGSLRTAFEQADEPDAVVGFRARIYGAMMPDGGGRSTNPLLAVRPSQITDAYLRGELTIEQHGSLLKELDQARADYERGIGVTKAATEVEAAQVVYNPNMTRPQKEQWVRDHKADFSGDDLGKWLGRIEVNSGSSVRADIFTQIHNTYRSSMQGKPEAEAERLGLLEYDAVNDMERYMAETAGKPGAEQLWQAKLHETLGNKVIEQLQARLLQLTGATRFPVAGMQAGRARELETAQEYGILAEYGKEMTEYETGLRKEALVQERAALTAKRVTVATSYEAKNRETVYQSADGTRYVVRNRNVGGVVKEVVYRLETVTEKDDEGKDIQIVRAVPLP